MKAKFVRESLLEFERGKTYDDVKDILQIGDQRVRDRTRLKRFAEENGYAFDEDPRNGTLRVTVPMEFEESHNYASTRDCEHWKNPKKFSVDSVQYTITYPEGWDEAGTPISLRKRWMKGGKGIKQTLMDRVATIGEAIKRIEKSIPKERAKSAK